VAEKIAGRRRHICPHSRATRGNARRCPRSSDRGTAKRSGLVRQVKTGSAGGAPGRALRSGSDVQVGWEAGNDQAGGTKPQLTPNYIVEPPELQKMAFYLLASIRVQFPPDVRAIGYRPEHRMTEIEPGDDPGA